MPRVEIPVTVVTTDGIAPATPINGDSANGHFVMNDGRTWLEVTNADGSNAHTLSVGLPNVDGQTVTPRPYPLPASTTGKKIKLGDPNIYGRKVLFAVDSSQVKITAYRTAL